MEQRSGPSFWLRELQSNGIVHSKDERSLPATATVVIIGAGMTGLVTAYWLTQCGLTDVLVLEQRDSLAQGATGRNGGHCWPSYLPFSPAWLQLYGREDEKKLFAFKKSSFELLRDFAKTHDIACDYWNCGSLTLARYESAVPFFKELIERAKNVDPSLELEWWDKDTCQKHLHSPCFVGGMYQSAAASFHPARVAHALAEEVRKLGARIFTGTQVLSVEEERKENENSQLPSSHCYKVRTAASGEVSSTVVVHATNAWASNLVPWLEGLIVPTRGQALATSPIPQLRWLYNLAFDDGYQYMIQRSDGRVVLGGMRWVSPTKERNTLDDSVHNIEISQKLHEFLEETFPDLQEDKGQGVNEGKVPFKVEFEWTGIMAYSRDGLPLIGPLEPLTQTTPFAEGTLFSPDLLCEKIRKIITIPGRGGLRPGQYIAAGYTGNGMANCFAAGKALANMILGQLSPEHFVQCLLPSRFFDEAKRQQIERKAEEEGDW